MHHCARPDRVTKSRHIALIVGLLPALVLGLSGCKGAGVETGAEAVGKGKIPSLPDLPDPRTPSPTCLADSDCATLATTTCVAAVCNPVSKRCELGLRPDFSVCDDADPCTVESVCAGGACTGTRPTDCDDGNPCTADSCEPAKGGCTHAPKSLAPCTDGNPCTLGDHCEGGKCATGENVCACAGDADCQVSGADPCVGTLLCSKGVCTTAPGTAKSCDDGDTCTADTCGKDGQCAHQPVADGKPCQDGDVCTLGEQCVGGACKGQATLPCGAGDGGCLTEVCDPKLGCQPAAAVDGKACDDGNACTADDSCKQGICGGTSTCGCVQDADCEGQDQVPACLGKLVCRTGHCEVDANLAEPCDPAEAACMMAICTGKGCATVKAPAGAPCDDGTACTWGDHCDPASKCLPGVELVCDDGDTCTQEFCVPSTGCLSGPGGDGQPCDDGNPCTSGDHCDKQVCVGATSECDDDNPCTVDLCNPLKKGGCLHKEMAQGAPCDDGDTCTGGERCISGACLPEKVVDCDDDNACTADTCTTDGGCLHTKVSNGAGVVCDDGDSCTVEDACVDGQCAGKPGACQCVKNGDCAAFEDGDLCNGTLQCKGNTCVLDPSTPVTCVDDGNPCVDTSCAPKTGLCVQKPKTSTGGQPTPCDDGNACTQYETCQTGGTCGGGTLLACDDGDPCTVDGCAPLKGCVAEPVSAQAAIPCDDGDDCTKGDVCAAGGCQPGKDTCQCKADADCAAFDDADVCNGGLVCVQGACVSDGKGVICPSDGSGPCVEMKCQPTSGACVATQLPDGAACGGDGKCPGTGVCKAGTCGGAGGLCDDGNPCTADTCMPTVGCVHTAKAGYACEDGNHCTVAQTCTTEGTCAGGQNICECESDAACPDDGDLCNGSPACVANKCVVKPGSVVTCDPTQNNPCTTNTCQPADGSCALVHKPIGALCDDGNACTVGESCGSADCAGGQAAKCDDGNPCTDDGCNPAKGCYALANAAACDDGDPCTLGDVCSGGACQAGPGKCECLNDAQCAAKDDGNLCNGVMSCQAGMCKPKPDSVVVCDASGDQPCAANLCDPGTGLCAMTPFPDATQCDDGSACTTKDQCVAGACTGTLFGCDDGNPCSDDACDPQLGCVHAENTVACDDGNPCTSGDRCKAGACLPGQDICGQCQSDADCEAKDDGDKCNGVLQCAGGQCQPKPDSAVVCADDGNPCTVSSCLPTSGLCQVQSLPQGAPCDDGDACTASSACFGNACVGAAPLNCDDQQPCTIDSCDPNAGCVHAPKLGGCDDGNPCTAPDLCSAAGVCQGGVNLCECQSDDECAAKDDGDLCNGQLICGPANTCVVKPGSVVSCDPAANTACSVQTCDPQDGQCKGKALADGAACDDGSVCTGADACKDGSCTGTLLPCDDGNACTLDNCDAATGCAHPADDGASCQDGNACTANDLCQGGACQGGVNTCECQTTADCLIHEDGDLCNGTLLCGAGNKCVLDPATVVTCPAGEACTAQTCDAKTGACQAKPVVDGTPCGGDALCGGLGQCQSGKCQGDLGCPDDGNVCTVATCDGQGVCGAQPVAGPCDDGDPCTAGDVCAAGVCASGPDTCDCKVDADCADQDDGDLCNGLQVCTAGKCALDPGSVVTCPPAQDACAKVACNPNSGQCVQSAQPDGTACPDGSACTVAEQCFKGACVVQPLPCDDKNECTDDACNPQSGCTHTPAGGLKTCDDGDECTPFSLCMQGVCTGPINTCTCNSDADCADDGDACNGVKTCQQGTCKDKPGSAVVCDTSGDGPCLLTSCVPASGECVQSPVPPGKSCDDGSQCTGGDTCTLGQCVGVPVACDDGITCTLDHCDPKTGCTTEPLNHVCTDGNPCTDDECNGVVGCLHKPKIGAACDDGDLCTVGESCVSGSGGVWCMGGSAPACDDGDPCTSDGCVNTVGCVHNPASGPCDDGNPCTEGDACQQGPNGECQGQTKNCDDGNSCTADACTAAGVCSQTPQPGACDDGNLCTGQDICLAGACTGGAPPTCDDANPCTDDSCEPAQGCVHAPNNAPCDDNDLCTSGEICAQGACQGGTQVCECLQDTDCAGKEDGDQCNGTLVCVANKCEVDPATIVDCSGVPVPACQVAACDAPTGQCVIKLQPEGTPCSDNSACTSNDGCAAGKCMGAPVDCGPSDPCVTRACEPTTGCSEVKHEGVACDDGDLCTSEDRCTDGLCGGVQVCECQQDADCKVYDNTKNLCEGTHVCTANKCVIDPSTVPDCSGGPSGPCFKPGCDPSTGGCINVVAPLGTPCDDGSACTSGEACVGETCQGTAVVCNDGNQCTADSCDASQGCVFAPADGLGCDDGDKCTSPDVCQGGKCLPGKDICGCTQNSDCADGVVCTEDLCDLATGQCNNPPIAGCCMHDQQCASPGDPPCIPTVCETQSGKCQPQPLPDGAGCQDGSVCTTADACKAGKCIGQPVDCNDNNVCTSDACDGKSGCTHKPTSGLCDDNNPCTVDDLCTDGKCLGGSNVCQCQGDADCAKLEDGDACNGTLICQSNSCVIDPKTVVTCDTSGDTACKITKCLPQLGVCQTSTSPAGASCDDGDACTTSDTCKSGATCSGVSKPCGDGNPCTADSCDPKTGCVHTPLSGTGCSDGNGCTDKDVCVAGQCQGTPVACECTQDQDCAAKEDGDLCNGTLRCVASACVVDPTTVVDCSHLADPPCGAYACVPQTGQCVSKAVPDGTPCNDGDACSLGDACQSALCKGVPKTCIDGNACSVDTCDKLTGECSFVPVVGQACDDGNACTGPDLCTASAGCQGAAKNCDDGNGCTFDLCQSPQGCLNIPISAPCEDGDPCTSPDMCQSSACVSGPKKPDCCTGPASCDDGNPCTVDACDGASGACVHKPLFGQPCEDGDVCTGPDQCDDQGVCKGLPKSCDDGNPCTEDSCSPTTGACTHKQTSGFSQDFSIDMGGAQVTSNSSLITFQLSKAQFSSPPASLYAGYIVPLTGQHTYNVPVAGLVLASATFPDVAIPPGVSSATFRYKLRYDRDKTEPESCQGLNDQVAALVNNQPVASVCKNVAAFTEQVVSLDSFIGQTVAVGFGFLANATANNGQGAWFDDARLEWTCQ